MLRSKQCHHNISAALVLVLGLLVPATTPRAQSSGNPGVFPPNARPHGLSYGEWSARWWQWALSIPAATNPLLDEDGTNCAEGQAGPVWFLAGTLGGSAERTCTIPTGTALFFPILNTFSACDPAPAECQSVEEMRAALASLMDDPLVLEASIDGVPVQALPSYRATSPVFDLTLPEDNVFGVPAGTYTPAVSDGYWLMVKPLPPGSHTLSFKGTGSDGFTTEVTYHLTVVPGRRPAR